MLQIKRRPCEDRINVRLTPEDHANIDTISAKLATQAGRVVTMTETFRAALRAAAKALEGTTDG